MNTFTPDSFRQQFPLIEKLTCAATANEQTFNCQVYFDNAATTQKFQQVIDKEVSYYQEYNANVHRASHQLSTKATIEFEQSRERIKSFINARDVKEIIWTKGATESLNLIAQCYGLENLKPGDEIAISIAEHHANIVPWQIVAEKTGAIIKPLPINTSGCVDDESINQLINANTKIVCCAHISNVIGKVNPIEKLIAKAKEVGAVSIIDGTQAVAHMPIDVQTLACDFYVFSAHKMYGPTGVGVLYGKRELLENMSPYQSGGEMIKSVSFTKPTTFNELPFKFEAGTPNIAGIIAFGECINNFQPLFNGNCEYQKHETALKHYCYQKLSDIAEVNFLTSGEPDIAVFAFTLTGFHNQDVATSLDQHGIAMRNGHHCAMPLMESLNKTGCLRISLSAYNTFEEIDYFISCLQLIIAGNSENSDTVLNEAASETVSKLQINDNAVDVSSAQRIEIEQCFEKAKSWDSKHREIMLLGKKLDRLPKEFRAEESLISGCESLAWLTAEQGVDGKFVFYADSDAKVIRGLLVIILAAVNHKSAMEIQQLDVKSYFNDLGLSHHLSPSRSNGLLAIVDKIKCLVAS